MLRLQLQVRKRRFVDALQYKKQQTPRKKLKAETGHFENRSMRRLQIKA